MNYEHENVTYSATRDIGNPPTAKEIMEFCSGVPPHAVVHMRAGGRNEDPRVITATWGKYPAHN